jgi:hypothetical protein
VPASAITPLAVLANPPAVQGAALAVGSATVAAAADPSTEAAKAPTIRRRITVADQFIDSYPSVSVQARLLKVSHVDPSDAPAASQPMKAICFPEGGQIERRPEGIFIR